MGEHAEGSDWVQSQPCSTLHVELQPSPKAVLPSSQRSVPSNTPFPQVAAPVEAGDPEPPPSASPLAPASPAATPAPPADVVPKSRRGEEHAAATKKLAKPIETNERYRRNSVITFS
jgi:hypothetical protein